MDPDRILRRLVLPLGGIILFVVIVAAIASGGDDNSSSVTPISTTTTTPTTLSTADLIDQADSICAEANAALASVDATGDSATAAATEESILQSELDSLQALGAPETGVAAFNSYLGALQAQVDAVHRKNLATDRGDDTALAAAEGDLTAAEAEAATAADDFGLKECGGGTTTGGTGTATTPTSTVPTTTPATTPTTPTGGTGGDTGGSTGTGGGGSGGGGSSGGIGPG
jgi:hypothetical protein